MYSPTKHLQCRRLISVFKNTPYKILVKVGSTGKAAYIKTSLKPGLFAVLLTTSFIFLNFASLLLHPNQSVTPVGITPNSTNYLANSPNSPRTLSSYLIPATPKALAATNSTLNFQARLLTSAGSIVTDGFYNVEFKLYSASSGGSALWTDTRYDQNGVTAGLDYRLRVVNGYVTVNLADTTVGGTAFPSLNWDQDMWLTMNIGGTTQTASPTWDGEMSPRIKLTATPYSFQAGQLKTTSGANSTTLGFTTPTGTDTINLPDESGTLCIQTSTNCGFAASSGSSSYIQNGTSTQTANFNVQSSSLSSVVATIQGAASQSADLLDLKTSTPATVLSVSASGALLSKNSADSTTAFSIQNAAGTPILNIDTSNKYVYIGNPTADAAANLLILDTKNTAGDPTGVNGAIYYNSSSNKIRCYQNSSWSDCIGAGGGGGASTLQDAYDNSSSPATINTADAKNFVINAADTATDSSIIFNLQCVTSCSTNGVFAIQNAGTNVFTVNPNGGSVLAKNTTNSTTAFQVQNSSGTQLLVADTTNSNLYVGSTTADATGSLLVLDTKNTAGDPTGINGGMYYNSNSNAFRCYEGGVWKSCIASTTLQQAYDNSSSPATINTADAKNFVINAADTATDSSIIFNLQCVTSCSTNGVFAIQNAGTNVFTVNPNGGSVLAKNTTNSTTAFQVQNSSGTQLLVADTTNSNLYVGSTTADATGSLLVLDTKNTAGDPTGINGGMYYNSNSGTFRCYQNSAWVDCLSGTLQTAYDNSSSPATINTADAKNFVINAADTATDSSIIFNLQCVISCSTNGVFAIQNAGTNVFTVNPNGGSVLAKNTTNSTTAFQVQNSSGTQLLVADTTNSNLYVGSTTADATGSLLVLDTKNTAGDPTGINGGMYYNSNSATFRCYQAGAWTDCNSGTIQQAYDNSSSPATINTADAKNFVINAADTATDSSIIFNLQCVTSCSTNGVFAIQNAGTNVFTVNPNGGSVLAKNTTNSTTAFQVQNSSGTQLLVADTTNSNLYVGSTTADATGSLLVLDTKNTAGDPTGINGGMYYNSNSATFRCYQAGAWTDCNSGTIQQAYDNSSSPATINTADAKNFVINAADTATDSSIIFNLQCVTSCSTNGVFAIQNTGTNVFTVNPNGGSVLAKNTTNSTTAFQVQNSSGTQLLVADTTNSNLYVGSTTADATGSLLVLDTKNTAGDPTGINGGMYYNSNSNAFRCYEGGVWKSCTALLTLQNAYDNSSSPATINTADAKNFVINAADTATDSSIIFNLQCVTSCSTNGVFAIQNTGTNVFTVNPNGGSVLAKNTTNSTTAFQVQNSSGTQLLVADTTNSNLYVGSTTADATGSLLVLDTKNTAGDPTGINGGMYYNSNSATFRCYQAGAWTDCNSGTIQQAYDNSSSPATINTADAKNFVINAADTATDSSIIFNLQCVTSCSTNGVFAIQNTGTNVFTVNPNGGSVLAKNTTNSTTAFQVQNSSGTQLLVADTTNSNLYVGSTTADATGSLLVLDTKNTAGDPTGINGGMYYNSNSATFRCYQAGAWTDCNSGTIQQAYDNSSSPATINTADAKNFVINAADTATDSSIIFNLQCVTSCSTNGVFAIQNAGTNVFTVNPNGGSVLAKNTTNSTTAFQVQNSSGTQLLVADTTNSNLYVGSTTADATGSLLVLDTKNTAGDPTGINGGMYYNSNSGTFRCYESGSWKDCITTAGSLTLQNTYDNSSSPATINTADAKNFVINAADTATDSSIIFNLQCVISCSTNGVFAIQNAGTNVFTVNPNGGSVLAKNTTNSTTAFQVQNSSGTQLLVADTTNSNLYVGSTTADATGSLLVLDTKNTAGDPTGINGGMYYNSNSATFRCYQAGAWTDCNSGTIQQAYDNSSSPATINTADAKNFVINAADTATDSSIIFNLQCVTSCSTNGVFAIQNAGTNVFTVNPNGGSVLAKNTTNSTTAFQVQNSSGTQLLVADTTNSNLYVGSTTADATGSLLVLDTKNTAGDPTGINGGMYYNSNSNAFRCYEGGVWKSCTALLTLQNAYDNSSSPATINTADAKNFVINAADTATDSSIIFNLQCVTSCSTNGVFAIQNAGTNVFTVNPNGGSVLAKNTTNSTTAFQVQNSSGTQLLVADTTNSNLYVGSTTADATGSLLVLDTKNTAGDPTGINGGLYYNSSAGALRCYENGSWKSCIASITLQNTYDNSSSPATINTADAKNFVINAADTATDSSIIFNLQCVTSCSTNGVFAIQNAGTNVFTVNPNGGSVLAKNTTNSTTAFQVQNSSGTQLLVADTTNSNLYVGSTTADATGSLLVLDTKNTAGDPTGINGGMYYNSNSATFRCYQAGAWTDCNSGTIQQAYDNSSSPATINTADAKNFVINAADTATDSSIIFNLQCVTSCSTNGVFAIQNAGTNVFTVNPNGGSVLAKNTTNSTTAFQVQNSSGTQLLVADTTNSNLYVGSTTADATGSLLVLDTKNTAGDPTGINGGMYYNSNSGTFRCYESGSWKNCIASTSSVTLQNTYDNSSSPATINTADAKNFVINAADTATDSSIIFNLQCVTSCSTNGVFAIQNTGTNVFTVNPNGGSVLAKNTTNSTTAFQVQNSSGTQLLVADTTNSNLYVGSTTADATGSLLVLDTKNTAGDPTGINGGLYYNSSAGALRCYENGSWKNCIATSSSSNLQGAYDNSSSPATINTSDAKNFVLNATDTTTDSSVIFNLQCTTCSSNGGRFAVQNAGTDVFTVNPVTGSILIKNKTDQTNAFQVTNLAGSNQFNIDNSANKVTIGVSDATATVLVLDTKTTAGDPTGTNGAMYYNGNSNTFRCYKNGAWQDCNTVTGTVTLQTAYTNSSSPATINTTDAKNLVINAADTATDSSVLVNLQCVTSCSTNGRFAVQNAGTDVFTVNPNGGSVLFKNTTNSSTAFRVQNSAGTTTLLNIDTSAATLTVGGSILASTTGFTLGNSTTNFSNLFSTGGVTSNSASTAFNLSVNSVNAISVDPTTATLTANNNSFLVKTSSTNNTQTLAVQNAAGTNLFSVDSVNTALYVNGNIAISTSPVNSTAANVQTSIDTANTSGQYSSIAIGVDGKPVIAYYDSTATTLKVAKCSTVDCSGTTAVNTVDVTAGSGQYNSIAIGKDGNPVIAYYITSNSGDLKVVKCGNPACSSGNTATLLESTIANTGQYTSIAIGIDGYPMIAYYDATNGDLKSVKCNNASCTASSINPVEVTGSNVGQYTSIAIGTDGLPVISYYDATTTAGDLRVAKCIDISCSGAVTPTAVDSTASGVGQYSSIMIGSDGNPVISYYDATATNLKVIKCITASCSTTTSANATAIDAAATDTGRYSSISMSTDGFPIVSYYDNGANLNLKVAKCTVLDCSANTVTAVDSGVAGGTGTLDVGQYSSIKVGNDGLPVISYYDLSNADLRVTRCGVASCAAPTGTVITGGLGLGSANNVLQYAYANSIRASDPINPFTIQVNGVNRLIIDPTTLTSTLSTKLIIGSSTSDSLQNLLQLDSFNTFLDTATCSSSTNQGAMYYNTNANSLQMRICNNGTWQDMASTEGLGAILFGVVPDSGPSPGDLVGINASITSSGPCKVFVGTANTAIQWTGCTVYSNGRKQVIANNFSDTPLSVGAGTSIWQHLCISSAGSGPQLTVINTEVLNLPTFSATAPVLCLADIKVTNGSAVITDIYDTRVFTTTTKQEVNIVTTAPGLGWLVTTTATAGQYTPTGTTAGTGKIAGVVVATAGGTTANSINAIIATAGPAYVKATAGNINDYVQNGPTTNGYANTAGAASANLYATVGLAGSQFSNTCTQNSNLDDCRGSLFIIFSLR